MINREYLKNLNEAQKEAVMYLFASLDLTGSVTPKELMQELVYRFGPPDIFQFKCCLDCLLSC